ncbi:hypothetical protein HHI36_003269 [Cryptolaemus montrouzieri]|uniref:Uncharacterized protein n=1 Tax=Cryptolaemus montrouzieri TaxID=559131 RepID=A0ABD2PDF0_9CUCU
MPSYLTETKSDVDIPRSRISLDPMPNTNSLSTTTESRKKSLMERRTSKSLNLRIECVGDHCREVPIIRQNSMPKFFLETPESHQIESAIFKPTSSALTIPVPVTNRHGFVYDLSSVVQMEKERVFNSHQVPDRGNKKQFRDKIIKLRRIKSSTSVFQSHHM